MKGPVLMVRWLDAMAIAEWTEVGSGIVRQEIESYGRLVEEDADHIVLAACYGQSLIGRGYNAAIMIPRGMIVGEMVELLPADVQSAGARVPIGRGRPPKNAGGTFPPIFPRCFRHVPAFCDRFAALRRFANRRLTYVNQRVRWWAL